MLQGDTPDRWKRVYQIAQLLLGNPHDQRQAIAERECGGDRKLLDSVWDLVRRSSDPNDFLEFSPLPNTPAIPAGARIGPYRVVRELGQGGMGQVLLAERDDGQFAKQVALKLVSGIPSRELLFRFRRERQILANLEHPNIARLIDGGETVDGIPYLVMEFVDGLPLLEHCGQNSLGIADRVRLFLDVCRAAEYAHQNLIIHRDLKPSNIFVSREGEPKLLDFGIAKLMEQDGASSEATTRAGLLTPNYASPDQIRGKNITTATDIYSLGVVLYELLTGQLPYELKGLPLVDALRVVCEQEPVPARRMKREIGKDLEAVLAHALEKEPAARYCQVQDLRRDLERYLSGHPVHAMRATATYRGYRFLRRHRSKIAAALLLVAAGAGTLATLSEKKRADQHAEEVRELARTFISRSDSLANLPGNTALRKQMAEDASRYLVRVAKEAPSSPELDREVANAYRRLADVQGAGQNNIGDLAGAVSSLERAITILEPLVKRRSADAALQFDLAASLFQLGHVYVSAADPQKAQVLERAVAILDSLPREWEANSSFQEVMAGALADLSWASLVRGERDHATVWGRKGVDLCDRYLALHPTSPEARRRAGVARERLAIRMTRPGYPAEPSDIARQAVELLRSNVGTPAGISPAELRLSRQQLARALCTFGETEFNRKKFASSEAALREAIEIAQDLVDADPVERRATAVLVRAESLRAATAKAQGRIQESRAIARRILEIAWGSFDSTPPGQDADFAIVQGWYAALDDLLSPLSGDDEALVRRALDRWTPRAGEGARWARMWTVTLQSLGAAAQARHNYPLALDFRRKAVAAATRSLNLRADTLGAMFEQAQAYAYLGESARAAGVPQEACFAFRRSVELIDQVIRARPDDALMPVRSTASAALARCP